MRRIRNKDIFTVVLLIIIGIAWFSLKEGNIRNSILVVGFALLPLLLMSESPFVELEEK